jgi:hypothetical protein
MKIPLFLSLMFFNCSLFAQHNFTKVDRELVKKAVMDKSKPTYYPQLLKRFNAFDTTLSADEYRLIYFGYAFQDAYSGVEPDTKPINDALAGKDYCYKSL